MRVLWHNNKHVLVGVALLSCSVLWLRLVCISNRNDLSLRFASAVRPKPSARNPTGVNRVRVGRRVRTVCERVCTLEVQGSPYGGDTAHSSDTVQENSKNLLMRLQELRASLTRTPGVVVNLRMLTSLEPTGTCGYTLHAFD